VNVIDLVASCESGFASVVIDSKRAGAVELSSGGNDVPGDANLRVEPAALFATEELAFTAWCETFDAFAGDRSNRVLIWVDKPYVETYRITLGDSHGTFRVVRDRYVVRGKVVIELNDGVALTNAGHPVGEAVAEDRDLSPDSIETIELDEEALKPSGQPLKVKRKRKAKAA
jgi:hypothetical protein